MRQTRPPAPPAACLSPADRDVPPIRSATPIDTSLDSIIALSPGPFHRPANLHGHTLGCSTPGMAEALAHAMIASAGLRPDQVRMVDVRFQIRSAVTTHRVDATISVHRNKEIREPVAHGLHATRFLPGQNGVPPDDELIHVTRRLRMLPGRSGSSPPCARPRPGCWPTRNTARPMEPPTARRRRRPCCTPSGWRRSTISPGSLDGPRHVASGRLAQGPIATVPPLDRIAVGTGDGP